MERRCGNCAFVWTKEHPKTDDRLNKYGSVEYGDPAWTERRCRRNPPQVSVYRDDYNRDVEITVFPRVGEHDWCGEFRPSTSKGDG
jgi:hypothetical protein